MPNSISSRPQVWTQRGRRRRGPVRLLLTSFLGPPQESLVVAAPPCPVAFLRLIGNHTTQGKECREWGQVGSGTEGPRPFPALQLLR